MPPKLPWFPFYGRDFFEDEKVQQMSHEQVGIYLRLLQHQWVEGSVTERAALSYCVKGMRGQRQAILSVFVNCFTMFSREDGRMMNPRLETIRAEQLEKERIRHERAVKGGRARQAQQAEPQAEPQASSKLSNKLGDSEADSEADTDTSLPKGFSSAQSSRTPKPKSALDLLDYGWGPGILPPLQPVDNQ